MKQKEYVNLCHKGIPHCHRLQVRERYRTEDMCRNLSERGRAFEAIGDTAKALAKVGSTSGIVAALPRIADCIKDALPHMSRSRSTGFSLEALEVSNWSAVLLDKSF